MFYELTQEDAELLGVLMALVARANILWARRRWYDLKFYQGRYFELSWRPWEYTATGRAFIAPIDTVADAEHLRDAIEAVRRDIEKAGADDRFAGKPSDAFGASSLLRKGANEEADG